MQGQHVGKSLQGSLAHLQAYTWLYQPYTLKAEKLDQTKDRSLEVEPFTDKSFSGKNEHIIQGRRTER